LAISTDEINSDMLQIQMSTPIGIHQLSKHFGPTVAVDAVDLNIEPAELFFLLGPSGCGKTTLLRMIAGFTEPSAGSIRFDQRDVTQLGANKRNCGMVFQGYALWPHMTVRQNIAFGLEVRRMDKATRDKHVDDVLRIVEMGSYAQRKPNELSGGQQQRVALARALVIKPTVLLLDEPLSNLDAKLRIAMRTQIRDICKQAGTTAVYVTHDQTEALSMADRIAVLNEGKLIQVGDPRSVYHHPRSRFVADFLGEANFLDATIKGRDGQCVLLDSPIGPLRSSVFSSDLPKSGAVTCCIRPEAVHRLHDEEKEPPFNSMTAKCLETIFLGQLIKHHLAFNDSITWTAYEINPGRVSDQPQSMRLHFQADDLVILEG
jgi:iron(III) transport system ATP-binding protein